MDDAQEDAELREQWRLLGVDPDRARAANTPAGAQSDTSETPQAQTTPQGDYELPPALWPAWECFVATWTQWRIVAGMGGVFYEGIDYASLAAVMDMLGIAQRQRRKTLAMVQVLEAEARVLRNRP